LLELWKWEFVFWMKNLSRIWPSNCIYKALQNEQENMGIRRRRRLVEEKGRSIRVGR
jgi:hypothetical protein